MKATSIIKNIAGHICIICSLSFAVIQILDWFNPLMDFMGHSMFLLDALCIASVFLGVCEINRHSPGKRPEPARKKRERGRPERRHRNGRGKFQDFFPEK